MEDQQPRLFMLFLHLQIAQERAEASPCCQQLCRDNQGIPTRCLSWVLVLNPTYPKCCRWSWVTQGLLMGSDHWARTCSGPVSCKLTRVVSAGSVSAGIYSLGVLPSRCRPQPRFSLLALLIKQTEPVKWPCRERESASLLLPWLWLLAARGDSCSSGIWGIWCLTKQLRQILPTHSPDLRPLRDSTHPATALERGKTPGPQSAFSSWPSTAWFGL